MTASAPSATSVAEDLDRMAAAFTTLSRVLLAPPEQDVLDQLRDAERTFRP